MLKYQCKNQISSKTRNVFFLVIGTVLFIFKMPVILKPYQKSQNHFIDDENENAEEEEKVNFNQMEGKNVEVEG